MKKLLLLVSVCLLGGCTSTQYQDGKGVVVKRTAFGTKMTVGKLSIAKDTNGVVNVQMENYQNDQVQALEKVTEAAVRAAITSLTGVSTGTIPATK